MPEGPSLPAASAALPSSPTWRDRAWLAVVVASIIAFGLVAACATPFAALAAVAALTLSRGDAVRITIALWLADQIVGYAIHGYPRTLESLAWGAAIGAAALLATWIARAVVTRLHVTAPLTRALSALLAAFAVYEAALFAVAVSGLGGTESFTPAIVSRILAVNGAAFVGLWGLYRLGAAIGVRHPWGPAPVSVTRPVSP